MSKSKTSSKASKQATTKKPVANKKQKVEAAETLAALNPAFLNDADTAALAESKAEPSEQPAAEAVPTRDSRGEWVGPVGDALKRGKQRQAAATKTDEPAAEQKPKRESDGLMDMEVDALKTLYTEVVGRPTGSDHKGYLVWKIREARKGKVRVGPRAARSASGADMKVIPVRVESELLGALEGVIGSLGLGSRNALFREALREYLTNHDHAELAAKMVEGGFAAAPTAAE